MKKRMGSLVLALVLCLGLAVSAAPARAAGKVVYIYTAQDLKEFGERVSDENDLSAVLMADIDLTGVDALPLGMKTIVLGPSLGVRREIGYSGTFDGNGHTISNADSLLLVNLSPGGVVKNLNIVNGYCIAEYNCGLIENCTVSGTSKGTTYSRYIGGIASTNGTGFYTETGWVTGPGTIRNCRSSQTITLQLPDADAQAYTNIGGIVGLADEGVIENCQYDGSITVSGPLLGCGVSIGGVAGMNFHASILNCGSAGTINADCYPGKGDHLAVGGVVGDVSFSDSMVANCWNTGKIQISAAGARISCNGIAGEILRYVDNCWSSGNVTIFAYGEEHNNARNSSSTCYFPAGTALCIGGSPTYPQADLTNGNLVAKLNEYVAAHPNDGLLAWKQGPNGPELTNSFTVPSVPSPSASVAYASTQSVLVDGKAVEFPCYALKDENGSDTNYIKLRDVAQILNGTSAQFEVSWDGAVNIVTGQPYTADGTELSTPFSGNRSYTVPASETKVNGQAANLDAIVLTDDAGNGYTYYKLRDLGAALGFSVDWSADKGIFIDTK